MRHLAILPILLANGALQAQEAGSSVQEAPTLRSMMPLPSCTRGCLSPAEAIAYATQLAPRAAVAAEFELVVKAVMADRGRIALYSESDPKDRNALVILLSPSAAVLNLGTADPNVLRSRLAGRRIAVRGVAQRVRVDAPAEMKPGAKPVYQVQVPVSSNRQIALLP